MTTQRYATPLSFKMALEQRLRATAKSGMDFARRRQLLVFGRFLARISRVFGDSVMLKGGLVLELRLERARTTRAVDLRLMGPFAEVLEQLQKAGQLDLGDYMKFEVQADTDHPEIQGDGLKYNGFRFWTECKLAGKRYGEPFGVDVAFGDPVFGEPTIISAEDVLGFLGIEPPKVRLYPVETHLAEKFHAYTMPRSRPNTRIKDLPDLALLATVGSLDAMRVRKALDQTFSFRGTHPLPTFVPEPPRAWSKSYVVMAEEDELRWKTLGDVTEAVRSFLEPVLVGDLRAAWDPSAWLWKTPE